MTHEVNHYDHTSNRDLLVPPMVWMELKCKRLDETLTTRGRHEIVAHIPRVPYRVDYEPERFVFTPLTQPDPPWRVVRGFIVGTYVLEAYTPADVSLIMWDVHGQENWHAGEEIIATTCTMPREG